MSYRIKRLITSAQIKKHAYNLGFDACGICKVSGVEAEQQQSFKSWIGNSFHADMDYMARNEEKRLDPALLVEGACSMVCVALNYYPSVKQPEEYPQFAYYAYGRDYHEVVKEKLNRLFDYIKTEEPSTLGRAFVDTAPILEHYWAAKAGLGFIGKNSLLIIPKKGSYFFLGELIVNLDLEYDEPLTSSCGNCTRCMDACPTKAIVKPKIVDAGKCISYQTIENKGKIDEAVVAGLNNRFYGCDICQQVCPYNRYARPHTTKEFSPDQLFLDLSIDRLENLTVEEYQQIFRGSAVKRAKYSGLKRNLEALKRSKK